MNFFGMELFNSFVSCDYCIKKQLTWCITREGNKSVIMLSRILWVLWVPSEVTSFPLIDLLSRALEIEDEELRTTGHHYYLPGESGEPYPTVLVADVSARNDEVWLMNVARQRDKIIYCQGLLLAPAHSYGV